MSQKLSPLPARSFPWGKMTILLVLFGLYGLFYAWLPSHGAFGERAMLNMPFSLTDMAATAWHEFTLRRIADSLCSTSGIITNTLLVVLAMYWWKNPTVWRSISLTLFIFAACTVFYAETWSLYAYSLKQYPHYKSTLPSWFPGPLIVFR